MPILIFFIVLLFGSVETTAQTDTTNVKDTLAANIFHKDKRLKRLGDEMAAYNKGLSQKTKMVTGYRLMVLNTNDRNYAFKVRNTLLQQFPEHKLYLVFMAPHIKLKMGNFTDKTAAEKFKKQLQDMRIVTGSIYLINEIVELAPPDKNGDTDEP